MSSPEEPSSEDKHFEIEIEFRGHTFTPDCATIHIYHQQQYNHIAIEEDEGIVGELLSREELEVLITHVATAVSHDYAPVNIRRWYEEQVNVWAGDLVFETGEFLDYNA